jgi:uncharacterized membrane protein
VQSYAECGGNPLGSAVMRAQNSSMRTPQRLAWLSIADGAMAAAVVWRWAFGGGPHHLIDAATAFALSIGFLGAVHVTRRRLAEFRKPSSLLEVERRDALLLFPAEGSHVATLPNVASQPPPTRPLWMAITAYGILMIALMWRWAVIGEPLTVFGAVTLSVLMLGFLRDAAITLESLGRSAPPKRKNEQPDALLLFPAEDIDANDLVLAPRIVATRR